MAFSYLPISTTAYKFSGFNSRIEAILRGGGTRSRAQKFSVTERRIKTSSMSLMGYIFLRIMLACRHIAMLRVEMRVQKEAKKKCGEKLDLLSYRPMTSRDIFLLYLTIASGEGILVFNLILFYI
jgi:hypothetical protein